MPPSYSYSIRSSARSRTASEPAIFLSWRTNEEKRMDIGEFIAGRTNYSKTKTRPKGLSSRAKREGAKQTKREVEGKRNTKLCHPERARRGASRGAMPLN